MDLLPDAIFLIGCNSKKIIDANQAACSLLGYSKQELAGSDSAWHHARCSLDNFGDSFGVQSG